jgi:RecB family endonuclease NucS
LGELNTFLDKPSLKLAVASLQTAIAKHMCVVLIGCCRVEYQGRARSILEPGERIIIIKQDGAILIHRPMNYEPVNWQPAGCHFRISSTDKSFLLTAIRRNPPEHLKICVNRVNALFIMRMIDKGRFSLHVTEREIQQAILQDPEILEVGFEPITYEKKVDPGFIDLYGLDSSGKLVVVEIKRIQAGKNAVLQLAKYVDSVRGETNKEVRGVLVAPHISKGVQRTLATLNLEYKKIDLEKIANRLKTTTEAKIHDFF